MVAGLYAHIPGLKEAEEAYSTAQVEAFIGMEPRIAGRIEAMPFTPQMFVELDLSGNRFFSTSEMPEEEDVAAFLWRVFPHYKRGAEDVRQEFVRLLNIVFIETPVPVLIGEIQAYVASAWAAMPATSSSGGAGLTSDVSSWPSHIVHMLASEYGWTEEYIMNLPFRRVWQYLHRIREDNNFKYKERCQRAVAIRAKWLEEQNRSN